VAITLFNFLSFYGKSGAELIDAGDLTKLANYTLGTTSGITALAGGGQTGATLLGIGYNEVDTVATNDDSVMLPPAIPGSFCFVNNAGANTLYIYANTSNPSNVSATTGAAIADQMIATNTNAKTAATGDISLASGHCTLFVCTTIGLWKQAFVS
jgi:hypothetical protein